MIQKTSCIIALFLLLGQATQAQWSIGAQASYLNGCPQVGSQYGVGIHANRVVAERFHVGASVRTWFKKSWGRSNAEGSINTSYAASAFTLSGDYEFSTGIFRMFAGTDIGFYSNSVNIQTTSSNTYVDEGFQDGVLGIAPKLGARIYSGNITPFIQVQYHIPAGGNRVAGEYEDPTSTDYFTLRTYGNFLTAECGVSFRIGK